MVSSHALTTLNWVCSVQLFWKNAGKYWKYDFRTLKWPKSEIFWNRVKPLRERPGWIFLVGNCLVVVVLMFGWCLVGFCWILTHLPLPGLRFTVLCTAILVIFGARGWVRGPWGGPCQHLLIGKDFDILLFDVWKGFELVFDHLRQLFFGHLSLFICMYVDFGVLRRGLLGGSLSVPELDLELREYSDLALFC